jgi:Acyl-[acyl carrier protein]--UDP-N-acetylglucosamine O-acyltransferase
MLVQRSYAYPDAYTAFATLLSKYQEMVTQQMSGIQQPSYIAKTASYGENVFIGAFAYLSENVKLVTIQKFSPAFSWEIM